MEDTKEEIRMPLGTVEVGDVYWTTREGWEHGIDALGATVEYREGSVMRASTTFMNPDGDHFTINPKDFNQMVWVRPNAC